jgi:hypothetical protein
MKWKNYPPDRRFEFVFEELILARDHERGEEWFDDIVITEIILGLLNHGNVRWFEGKDLDGFDKAIKKLRLYYGSFLCGKKGKKLRDLELKRLRANEAKTVRYYNSLWDEMSDEDLRAYVDRNISAEDKEKVENIVDLTIAKIRSKTVEWSAYRLTNLKIFDGLVESIVEEHEANDDE